MVTSQSVLGVRPQPPSYPTPSPLPPTMCRVCLTGPFSSDSLDFLRDPVRDPRVSSPSSFLCNVCRRPSTLYKDSTSESTVYYRLCPNPGWTRRSRTVWYSGRTTFGGALTGSRDLVVYVRRVPDVLEHTGPRDRRD